jgi:hypothetical protein
MVWRLDSEKNILIVPAIAPADTAAIVASKTVQNCHDEKSSVMKWKTTRFHLVMTGTAQSKLGKAQMHTTQSRYCPFLRIGQTMLPQVVTNAEIFGNMQSLIRAPAGVTSTIGGRKT